MNTLHKAPLRSTPLTHKIVLIAAALCAALILLEAGLRLGGFIVRKRQEKRHISFLRNKGSCLILCAGDSATLEQYPPLLESILNRQFPDIRFTVIDAGLPDLSTPAIVSRIETYLKTYRPDMVTSMMGINDRYSFRPWNNHNSLVTFLCSLKVATLSNFLWQRIEQYAQAACGWFVARKESWKETRLKNALTRTPRNDAAFFNLGWFYLKQGRYKKAKTLFIKTLDLNPENDAAYIGLGWLKRQQRAFSQAKKAFDKALELNPKSDWAYAELGWLYRLWDNPAVAEAYDEKALALNPRNTWAYYELGLLSLEKRNIAQAARHFERAIEVDRRNDWAYAGLGRIALNAGDFRKAELYFGKALAYNVRNSTAYVGLGRIYFYRYMFPQASKFFTQALASNPENDFAYLWQGRLLRAQGRLQEAKGYFEKALGVNPKNEWPYVELGRYYRSQTHFDTAQIFDLKALSINPRNDRAHYELGMAYLQQGRVQEAIAQFRNTLTLNPANDAACLQLAWILRIRRKTDEAIECLLQCLKAGSVKKTVLYGALKILYAQNGQATLSTLYKNAQKKLESARYNPVTTHNYLALKEMLDKRRIPLICIQYPLRDVENLKEIFGKQQGVYFVDNRNNFRDAVARKGYTTYFKDMFAGDFGHCTKEGNTLLAENIAATIRNLLSSDRSRATKAPLSVR